jgi:O-methyltransferase
MKSDIKTITREPWIDLSIKKSRKNSLQYNQTYRQREKYNFFQKAYDFLLANSIKGSYFEFGCHRARTFRFALRESIIKNIKQDFHAFDSFQGLPDEKNNHNQNKNFLAGLLKTNKSNFMKIIYKYKNYRKVYIHDGFYKDSLNKKLINKFKSNKIRVSFINLDCDLEKSIRVSLNFALKFIVDGTILYVDDYYNVYKGDPRKGNPKAVTDLLKKNKIFFEPWHIVGTCGKSFLLYK